MNLPKRFITLLFIVLNLSLLSFVIAQQSPDVPVANRTPTMQTFDVGSLIIDMGAYQIEDTTVMTDVVSSYYTNISSGADCGYTAATQYVNASKAGLFNLYSYGYAIRLLYAKIPVYWAIASNKADQTVYDISSISAMRVHPNRSPSGSNSNLWGGAVNVTGTYSFRNGPLVIRAADAPAAMTVLNNIKTAYGINKKGRFESLVIYKTTQTMTIDTRHKLTHTPFAFVSTLAGNWCTWSAIALVLMNIGLVDGVHYSLILRSNQLTAFSAQTCGTIFMEPHFVFDQAGCPDCVSTPQYIGPLNNFIKSGGNFWVQCAGITSYENSLWTSQFYPPSTNQQGAFISKYGIQGLGNKASNDGTINPWQNGINVQNLNYMNYDLPIAQYYGPIANQTGTVTSFYLRNDPVGNVDESTLWNNGGYGLIQQPYTTSNQWTNTANNQGTLGPCTRCCPGNIGGRCTTNNVLPGDGRRAYVAAGARLNALSGSLLGGNVWYYATHTVFFDAFQDLDSSYPSGYVETDRLYNGRRTLLNSLMVPAVRPTNCNQNFCSQDVDCTGQYGPCYKCTNSACVNTAPTTCGAVGVNLATCTCNSPSRTPTPTISTTTSLSPSTSLSGTPSRSLSSSSSKSLSNSISLSSTPSISLSRSISLSSTPTISVSRTPSTSLSSTPQSSFSTTTSLSSTSSISLSSTSSRSYSSTSSISISSSRSPSTSLTPSNSASASITPSASRSPVIAAGGGGSNTGTIVGAVVGSVVGVAVLAGLAAAAAAAAIIAYKKTRGAPVDTGNFTDNTAFQDVKQSNLFEGKNVEQSNPLYSHN